MEKLFANTGQSRQIFQLQDRVEELEAEIAQLRATATNAEDKAKLARQIEELTAKLAERGGVHEIEIESIRPDPAQPRTVFPQWLVQSRAKSLREEGQQSPIIVIPQEGWYKLFDGELRWRAAPLAEKRTLQAVYLLKSGLSATEIFDRQLTTSLQSQSLHGLDLANGLIGLLVYKYPEMEERKDEIPSILNAAIQRLKRSGGKVQEFEEIRVADAETQQKWLDTAGLTSDLEQKILAVILGKQLNPTSVNTNIFPLLKLPSDLKQAIQAEGLESSKVKELAKLSAVRLNTDEDTALVIRTQTTQEGIADKLSLEQIRDLVQKTLKQYSQSESHSDRRVERAIKQYQKLQVKQLKDSPRSSLEELRQVMRQKLQEIEILLEKTNRA
ncbi:hypothetical protein B7486_50765 [cyanobacterium TDX16]|nr:hypothetical protein B7486_50765 [cyanobacterium TDX16]